MDLGSIIIGILSISVIIIPILIMNKNRKKRKEKILENLKSIAVEKNCLISNYEFCGNFIIGIDDTKSYVFFYKKNNEAEATKVNVNLCNIADCKLINIGRTVGNSKIIDKAGIRFVPLSKTAPPLDMEFYNSEESMHMNGELQVAEKWQQLLREKIKRK